MKKILLGIGLILVLLIGLTYWSVSESEGKETTCQVLLPGDVDSINFKEYDSVKVAASVLYEGSVIKEIMQGEQYREAWATPVTVPIAYLDTLRGGLEVEEEGGGKQTHSLELKAKDGYRYTLRSVHKDPEPLIPETLKALGLENIVIDGVSAQHPYAAIVVSKLADKAEILHTKPQLYFLPSQGQLEGLDREYANGLYLLEFETTGPGQWTGIDKVSEILDTEDLQELKMMYPDKVAIDTAALVRARLFDLLIGDWDRHSKQWGWAVVEENDAYRAIPLPTDRDNAFFNIEGVIPNIIANKAILPELQNFREEIDYLPGLVMPVDLYFLKDVPTEIFTAEAKTLQSLLSDQAIEEAFDVWPRQIFSLHGREIMEKIKERRDDVVEYAVEFKRLIDDKPELQEPLKGSESLNLNKEQLPNFKHIKNG